MSSQSAPKYCRTLAQIFLSVPASKGVHTRFREAWHRISRSGQPQSERHPWDDYFNGSVSNPPQTTNVARKVRLNNQELDWSLSSCQPAGRAQILAAYHRFPHSHGHPHFGVGSRFDDPLAEMALTLRKVKDCGPWNRTWNPAKADSKSAPVSLDFEAPLKAKLRRAEFFIKQLEKMF